MPNLEQRLAALETSSGEHSLILVVANIGESSEDALAREGYSIKDHGVLCVTFVEARPLSDAT